jgi:hypothetical protein
VSGRQHQVWRDERAGAHFVGGENGNGECVFGVFDAALDGALLGSDALGGPPGGTRRKRDGENKSKRPTQHAKEL